MLSALLSEHNDPALTDHLRMISSVVQGLMVLALWVRHGKARA